MHLLNLLNYSFLIHANIFQYMGMFILDYYDLLMTSIYKLRNSLKILLLEYKYKNKFLFLYLSLI